MVKNILLTGASGTLGQHLLGALCAIGDSSPSSPPDDQQYNITAAYHSLETFESDASAKLPSHVKLVKNFDLSSANSIKSVLNAHGPFDVVVHLAAVSSPVVAEKNAEAARQINTPSAFLDALPATVQLIFLSTDQVYDGANAPYMENDEAKPVNLYGETKLEFERQLLNCKHVMCSVALRSSLILGPGTPLGACRKQTFLQFAHDRLKKQEETHFFTDEYRNVVYVKDICKQIKYFIDHGIGEKHGVYNMGGADRVSRLDIAMAVADHCGFDMTCAKGIERASLPHGPVASPPDISMNSTKLEEATGIKMLGLVDMVKLSLPTS